MWVCESTILDGLMFLLSFVFKIERVYTNIYDMPTKSSCFVKKSLIIAYLECVQMDVS